MNLLLIYYSKSGYTEKYAKAIATELTCKIIRYEDINKVNIKEYDTIIFGSRIIAGKIEKLKSIKKIIKKNKIKNLIIYTTGSTPNDAAKVLNEMWLKNLTKAELNTIPHFHMQSGMNIEKLPKKEKIMLNMAKKIISKKKNKTTKDIEFEKAISTTFDIYNEKYKKELIDYLKIKKQEE